MGKSFLVCAAAITAALGGAAGLGARDPSMAQEQGGLHLRWPVACTIGKTCWVQNYVDHDPSPGARDFTCGSLTYNGHDGTDIRLADMSVERAGVDVLAAADGRVLRIRDGVADISIRDGGMERVKGVECGNGLVIDHGGGWTTQYCHMAKSSLKVAPGVLVHAGDALGHVGLSGDTEFPHLHISVRHNGVLVDPFAYTTPVAKCGAVGPGLWVPAVVYVPRAVINAGFAGAAVQMESLENGGVSQPTAEAPYLVAYVRTIGLRQGDQTTLTLTGPDGQGLVTAPVERMAGNQAQRLLYIGKRRHGDRWPEGEYQARYTVTTADKQVLSYTFSLKL